MSQLISERTQLKPIRKELTEQERCKAMEEALKVAAQIRQELSRRKHSDSTELLAEDRKR
jgi:hypothetical protein